MNYLQSYIPIVKKIKGKDEDEWVFCIKNLNNLESKSNDEGEYDKYEPFVLDDISLDFSKIPVITISNGKLKYVNIQGEDFIGNAISCPYTPIEKIEKEETEKEIKTEEEKEEDKNDVNKSKDGNSKGNNNDNDNDDDDDYDYDDNNNNNKNDGKRKSTTSSGKGKKKTSTKKKTSKKKKNAK